MTATQTTSPPPPDPYVAHLIELIRHTLDEGKAQDIEIIDLVGKASFADAMIVASGTSSRQVIALADQVVSALRDAGFGRAQVEGEEFGDWVLIDAGDVIVHVFRPEVRLYYHIEKMWGGPLVPQRAVLD
jgi:ribosome-associated protein